jgi:hypothetical protein
MNATTTLLAVNRAADDDRTVVVSAHGPQAPHRSDLGSLSFDLVGNGLNPLLDAATALLNLATRVRGLPDHPDVDGLRLLVINEIKCDRPRRPLLPLQHGGRGRARHRMGQRRGLERPEPSEPFPQ